MLTENNFIKNNKETVLNDFVTVQDKLIKQQAFDGILCCFLK